MVSASQVSRFVKRNGKGGLLGAAIGTAVGIYNANNKLSGLTRKWADIAGSDAVQYIDDSLTQARKRFKQDLTPEAPVASVAPASSKSPVNSNASSIRYRPQGRIYNRMVYRRRSYRRRPPSRRRRFISRRSRLNRRTGGYIGRFTRPVRALGAEKKFNDTTSSVVLTKNVLAAVGSGPNSAGLIATGTGPSDRIGSRILLKSWALKGQITVDYGTSTQTSLPLYFYLVQDSQANGAQAAATDVFTSVDPAAAMPNLENSSRFRILKKWCTLIEPTIGALSAVGKTAMCFDYFRKLNLLIQYDTSDTTGVITALKSNNLILFASYGNNSTVTGVTFAYTVRQRYLDS